MPTLANFGDLPTILPDSLLSSSPLWKRELKTLKPLDLSLFIRLYKDTPNYFKAIREVDTLKNTLMQAYIDSDVDDSVSELLSHSLPTEQLTSGDLVEWLEGTTVMRCKAILLALELSIEPRIAIELTWKVLPKYRLTTLAVELLRSVPRHIRLPYVFWETLSNGAAAPLFGLHETVLEVSQGIGMVGLQRLYDTMLMLDTRADAEQFELDLK